MSSSIGEVLDMLEGKLISEEVLDDLLDALDDNCIGDWFPGLLSCPASIMVMSGISISCLESGDGN